MAAGDRQALPSLDVWTSALLTKSTAGRGSNSKLEAYGIKKLRELILELAVRGKLVPQDPDDEPASELLNRIRTEKAKLIAECKIKNDKPLAAITDEEKPFALPKNWEWVRLGTVVEVLDGFRMPVTKQDRIPGPYPYYGASGVVDYVSNFIFDEPLVLVGEDGAKWGRGENTAFLIAGKTWVNNHAHVIRPYRTVVIDDFVARSLNAMDLSEFITGMTVPKLNQARLVSIVLPLPPLSEQHRIVAKVDELMALCDQLEQQQTDSIEAHQTLVETLLGTLTRVESQQEFSAAWARIASHFDTLFTTEASIDQLKQTILQLAVMGKLVPQDPNDEPASVLLERLAAEKERLIDEGMINKDKPLPDWAEDELPFYLPRGWCWTKFENIVAISSGITLGRKLAGKKLVTLPYLRVANVQRGFLELDVMKEIELPVEEIEKFKVLVRDLLITEGGDWDKVGRTAIWRNELPLVVHQNHVFKARCILGEQNELWLEKYLNSEVARDYFAGSSKQTTNLASINKTQLRRCLIAIPPLAEQHRIVAKVDELMALCDTLKARIKDAQSIQLHLADAIVEQAVAA